MMCRILYYNNPKYVNYAMRSALSRREAGEGAPGTRPLTREKSTRDGLTAGPAATAGRSSAMQPSRRICWRHNIKTSSP